MDTHVSLLTQLGNLCCCKQPGDDSPTSDDDDINIKTAVLCCVKTNTVNVDLRDGDEDKRKSPRKPETTTAASKENATEFELCAT